MQKKWHTSSTYSYDTNAATQKRERAILVLAAVAAALVATWFRM